MAGLLIKAASPSSNISTANASRLIRTTYSNLYEGSKQSLWLYLFKVPLVRSCWSNTFRPELLTALECPADTTLAARSHHSVTLSCSSTQRTWKQQMQRTHGPPRLET